MILPVDFDRLQEALASPQGRIELAIALLCMVVAWAIDRRIERARAPGIDASRLAAGVVRVTFPLTALILISIAAILWRRHVGPPYAPGPDVWQRHSTPWRLWYRRLGDTPVGPEA